MRKTIIISLISLLFSSVDLLSQERIVIKSEYLKCNDTVLVFSPHGDSSAQTPALFLLHGWSGCYKDWSNKYNLQEISDRSGFRIICPDGFYNGWYLNNIDSGKMQWRTFWDKELFPKMKQQYHIKPESTFITGLSMGGHGAINLYLDHPENFRSAGSMSGVLNLQHTSLKDKYLSEIIGRYTPDNSLYDSESAVNRLHDYILKYPEASEKWLVITCGYEDYYSKCTIEFCEKCKELGIPYYESLSKADHSWKYWGFALENHIWFFRKILNGENLGE
jgi:putative tributyrin esterase